MRIYEKILKCSSERVLIKVLLKKIKKGFSVIRKFLDTVLAIPARLIITYTNKVVDNKVVFMTYNNDYMCNPKYICEEILKQNLPLDLVWVTTKKKKENPEQFPEGVRLVVRGSYEFFREIASAKVWVDNAVCFPWDPVLKKKSQIYLQTWHGSMGLKRIGTNDVKNLRWSIAAKLSGKWTTVCFSNSTFETDVFRQTHWPKTPIDEVGHARNDILFADGDTKARIRERICEFYEIPADKKIALYAPTFRNGDGVLYYNMEYSRMLDVLEEKFGGEWVLLNRFHFKSKSAKNIQIDDERIYQATSYPDMQELMVAADLGITDYSSWICDFVLTGNPGFIYAPDLGSYNEERGFYYPLSSTPFPVAENNDQMEENLRSFDPELYAQKREQFLRDRGCKEDGHASSRIVEKMLELMKK